MRIAGYCRISVDDEIGMDNTSIENQKSIITDFVGRTFPDCVLDIYEDRDRSGYTFEQREGYQALRAKMMNGDYDILIIKDFSRFSRRNSKGLVELEDIRDAGVRMISIGDNIDYPSQDDWMQIQMLFLFNELPVTQTSKKVRSVVRRRQEEGKWLCALPYGYVWKNAHHKEFEINEQEAQVVREIFRLYNEGAGYKKIARALTEKHIPTPRASEKARKEAAGEECRVRSRESWSIVTISGILSNDFYIGTLRQHKYTRRRINGSDVKLEESENLVFENDHEAIISPLLFAQVQEQIRQRSGSGYRGVKKFPNTYSGYLFCGDCGAPMFSMSRADLPAAYRCGTYHRQGKAYCSSHHTRVDMLDGILKSYVKKIRNNSQEMLEELTRAVAQEQQETRASRTVIENLEQQIENAKLEITALTRQRALDSMRHPERAELLEEIYGKQLDELALRIEGLQNQQHMAADRHNAVIQLNRSARTVFQVFDSILEKPSLSKQDVGLIVDRILMYTDRIEVYLKADVDELFQLTGAPLSLGLEEAANFPPDTERDHTSRIAQIPKIRTSKGDELSVNVISEGDPLEIYTDQDGEVIFKKYSPIDELADGAAQAAEVISKLGGAPALVFDKDHVVAVSGASRREFSQRRLSPALEDMLEERRSYEFSSGAQPFRPVEGMNVGALAVSPIISNGDINGAVAFLAPDEKTHVTPDQAMLCRAAAMFLGKQVEQ